MELNVKILENDELLLTPEPPDCWDGNQVKYFTGEYPWLFFNNKKIGYKICRNVNLNLTKRQGVHMGQKNGFMEILLQ